MRFLQIPARAANELALMDDALFSQLPAILDVIKPETFLEHAAIKNPGFLKACCMHVEPDKDIYRQVRALAIMSLKGEI